MKIPADTTCVIEFLIEAEYEESYEMMDYKILQSVVDEDTLPDFEDTDIAEFMDIEDGILVVIEPGIYKFNVAYNSSTEQFVKLSQDKLSEEDAAKCFGDIDFIPDANL